MLEHFFRSEERMQALLGGAGGPLLGGFAGDLRQAGYSRKSAHTHIRAAEHLMHWTEAEGMPLSDLTERVLDQFDQHVEHCRCPGFGATRRLYLFRGVRLFLEYLRRTGSATAFVEADRDPPLFVAFRRWMGQQRATADCTLDGYRLCIRALLSRLGEDPRKFDAGSLRRFVLEASQRSGWAAAKRHATALRMFLRFLITEGQCAPGLDAAIPVVAHWSLSPLPQYFLSEEVERIIASCDPASPVGKRDRAMLLLLARLGLRAGDVMNLRLDDIDWKEASIRICGKGRRETRMPLTQEVGDAVVDYLHAGRPHVDTDAVFLRALAPFRAFASHCAISMIVVRAMRRAGVVRPSRGAAHLLRHSVATAMLRQGASLQEIGVVLRHRSIETTRVYAKVDVTALQRIAQVWPEVHS